MLALLALAGAAAAAASYTNSSASASASASVDFVTGAYPEHVPLTAYAKCPSLNFDWINRGYYPKPTASVVSAFQLNDDDYEITLSFQAAGCPPLSNLDQAAIIGVASPEKSLYYLYDSNQKIHNINDPCNWEATFVVTGEAVGGAVCVPDFQIHYAWFSGLADDSYAASWPYHGAYEYSMGCVSDNNNNAQDDFSQYCFALASGPVVPSNISTSSTTSLSVPTSLASLYGQCGGENWKGATACVAGAVCSSMNPFYYQCVAGPTTVTTPAPAPTTPTLTTSTTSSTSTTSTTSTTTSSTTSTTPTAFQSLYGQCGGENWTGATACVTGAVCSSMNPFYYQCVAGPTPTTTSTTTEPTAVPTAFQSLYGQCGGENWTGPTACSEGVCSSMNPFYYQCVQTAW